MPATNGGLAVKYAHGETTPRANCGMTVFGRDSLITSYHALPFVPELAATLRFRVQANEPQQIAAHRRIRKVAPF